MLYILAIFFPPVAVFFAGKPFQALANLLLTLIGYVPGAIHAVLVVMAHRAHQRDIALYRALNDQT